VLWKIHGCDGGAAWLPPGVAGWFAEIEQSTRAAFPADRRRRHPLRGVLGLAGAPPSWRPAPPRNVPFYQSLGFQIVGEQQAPDGGPVIWFMPTPRPPSS